MCKLTRRAGAEEITVSNTELSEIFDRHRVHGKLGEWTLNPSMVRATGRRGTTSAPEGSETDHCYGFGEHGFEHRAQ